MIFLFNYKNFTIISFSIQLSLLILTMLVSQF